jgi:hypothetical protein
VTRKQALLFCEQKRSKKNFALAGCGAFRANAPRSGRFFASFFSKKEALSFPP